MMVTLFVGILGTFVTWNAFRSKQYPWSWKICSMLLWSSLLCLLVGEIGTSLDYDGIVHEVGPILPVGAILLCIGITGVTILSIMRVWHR